jgi:putative cell wall-binding protein
VATTVATLIGAPGIAASAAPASAPASLVSSSDSITATVYTQNHLLSGGWRVPIVYPDTTTVHVTLPQEAADLVVDGFTWTLTGYQDAATGSLPPGTGTFDVALPSSPPQSSIGLVINSVGTAPRDSVYLTVSLELSVPSVGTPPLTIANANLSRATAMYSDYATFVSAYPSPISIRPGADLTLAAPVGFWTAGPDGGWAGPDDPIIDAALLETDSESSIPLVTEVTPDGSGLHVAIPAELPDYVLDSASLRITVSAEQESSDGHPSSRVSFSAAAFFAYEPVVDRIDGADRYAVAVAVSQKAYPQGAPVAYVVTGSTFSDALSAGPAAAKDGGPLLLTNGSSLPSAVEGELRRLNPGRIVVVGGPESVPSTVFTQLGGIAPTERVSGADRYAVSRNLLAVAYPEGSASAYVATGATFPDALSAGAPAGKLGAPVVLVNGSAGTVDDATAAALRSLHPESLTIAGGPVSVSAGVEQALGAIAPTHRIGGADRYEVSTAINAEAYAFVDRAFLVTGSTFPDALTGSAWAGAVSAPLYVVRTDCVPAADLDAMRTRGVRTVTLIGGPNSLTQSVFDLTPCE